MNRRSLLALPALATLARPALAQARPTRLIVPFPAGGGTDAVSRLFAPLLGQRLGTTVVIENRPGAGGIPATEVVVRAPADGLTLLLATSSIHSTAPATGANLPYDVEADFTPLALIGSSPSLVLVSKTVPVNDLRGFIAWAKARRGQVNYGSSGVATTPHLNGALLDSLADLGMVHVPYRGTGAVYAELLRGDVHALLDVPATAATHIQSGTVKALAVTSAQETPLAPGVPTAEAAGLPGLISETWFGIFGPAGMPADLASRISQAAQDAMADPELRARLLGLGVAPRAGDGQALAAAARQERERWTDLVRRLNIRAAD
ncbi:Bug family tripartite tricarboxylate transporter substrate binding protein [Roseomonas xinghualingensis]|uniref:Bug family tripartite tricarboxylate transporter substrate binding protein n=1 Tax=Roseomonas xinghualingensis TaxID=2986475 RepID=UPI0021F15382|nr:tripartite tricarboxylate transporter substrate-binding protein [Roseomonas sp. SXEYE001]MCV4207832.1 tripartite tricarboxylate transporter substrate-binding protein [Roseomonas sp. SXEYE001]